MNREILIDRERCKGCEYCSSLCPKKIIHISQELNRKGYHYAIVGDVDGCSGCRFCALMCPDVAIKIKAVDQRE